MGWVLLWGSEKNIYIDRNLHDNICPTKEVDNTYRWIKSKLFVLVKRKQGPVLFIDCKGMLISQI